MADLTFNAATAGQTLTITYVVDTSYTGTEGNITLHAATLSTDVDLAAGKTATQSSTYVTGGNAGLAVEGNTNGDFQAGSVTHTSQSPVDANPWWQVDLGSSQQVSAVKLWNRTDCCSDRLRDFHVFASDTPFTSNDPQVTKSQSGVWNTYRATAAGTTLSLPVSRSARYIRVQLVGSERPLSLAEVQVLG
ncbi:discoidin domain-containing protein [Nonomuraea sp. SMC257]|uniref:Discoidin domain-containing protein n=1 Tax=Nonomuraea montanisoli TaxID=2741721 RepID=A0A7Y6ICB2_9ACTN|nr:discoidin domain-containing protein [Nonomuraea montanisoli]